MEERKVIRELLDSKQYTRLRQMLSELNDADTVSYTHLDVYKRQPSDAGGGLDE